MSLFYSQVFSIQNINIVRGITMGIKFNVLSDRLLTETSELKQFFTSSEPISFIHKELRLSHTAKPMLTPTDNRTVLQAALSEGKALFVKILDPIRIMTFTQNNIKEVLANETGKVPSSLSSIIEMPLPPSMTDIADVRKQIRISLDTGVSDKLEDALRAFRSATTTGKYILIKRVPENQEEQLYMSPSERRFSVFKRDPSQIGTGAKKAAGKVYGKQKFMVWYFDDDSFLSKSLKSENVIATYNEVFPGPNITRETYIIENKSFLSTAQHPYISSAQGIQFEKLLPIEQISINNFVQDAFKRFGDKLNEKIKQNSDLIRNKIDTSLGSLRVPESDLMSDIQEYRKALTYLNKGLDKVNYLQLFKDFMTRSSDHDMSQYTFVKPDKPFKYTQPYEEIPKRQLTRADLQKVSSEEGANLTKAVLQGDSVGSIWKTTPAKITVRLRSDPTQVSVTTVDKMRDPNIASQYYMLNPRRQIENKKWVPVDPEYLGGIESTGKDFFDVAIAFTKPGEYNKFTREFMKYAITTLIRSPKSSTLRKAMSLI